MLSQITERCPNCPAIHVAHLSRMREVDVLMVRVVFKLLGIWSTWKFFDFKALGTSAPKLLLVTCCCCLHTTGRRYQRANMYSIHDFMHRISDIYTYIYIYVCIPIILYVITIQYSSLHINNSRILVTATRAYPDAR